MNKIALIVSLILPMMAVTAEAEIRGNERPSEEKSNVRDAIRTPYHSTHALYHEDLQHLYEIFFNSMPTTTGVASESGNHFESSEEDLLGMLNILIDQRGAGDNLDQYRAVMAIEHAHSYGMNLKTSETVCYAFRNLLRPGNHRSMSIIRALIADNDPKDVQCEGMTLAQFIEDVEKYEDMIFDPSLKEEIAALEANYVNLRITSHVTDSPKMPDEIGEHHDVTEGIHVVFKYGQSQCDELTILGDIRRLLNVIDRSNKKNESLLLGDEACLRNYHISSQALQSAPDRTKLTERLSVIMSGDTAVSVEAHQ